jgi:hypothetical protein
MEAESLDLAFNHRYQRAPRFQSPPPKSPSTGECRHQPLLQLSRKVPFSTQTVDPPAASVNTRWGAHRSRTAGPGRVAGVEGTAALVVEPQTVIENTGYLAWGPIRPGGT